MSTVPVRHILFPTVLIAAGLAAPVVASAQHIPAQAASEDWNWADASPKEMPGFAASIAACKAVRDLDPPAADWPGSDVAASLVGCDSGALYYGIGMKADPVRARQCALMETQRPDGNDSPFRGTAMLMTIYANGRGAKKDLDLATSLACRIDDAPAAIDGRVQHLQALKQDESPGEFGYCDDITSGLSSGQCAAHEAALKTTGRSARRDKLTAGWSAAARQAFVPLQEAADFYAKTSGENEVDLSGTARAAFAVEQEERLRKSFADLLRTLESGGLKQGAAFKTEDARLNAVYRRIMASKTPPDERGPYASADSLPWTTVTRSGIRETQRAWLRYRDAWVAFAAVRYPALDADALRAELTRQRLAQLQGLLPRK